jgi:hypothetical protein
MPQNWTENTALSSPLLLFVNPLSRNVVLASLCLASRWLAMDVSAVLLWLYASGVRASYHGIVALLPACVRLEYVV